MSRLCLSADSDGSPSFHLILRSAQATLLAWCIAVRANLQPGERRLIHARAKPWLQLMSYFQIKSLTLLAWASLIGASAEAHIGYSGRNFGNFTGLDAASVVISTQAISGNYGWADAADADYGDSHKNRAFRFHLDNAAFVTITAQANATATATSIGGLLPAFTVYGGLAHISPAPADYDTAAITLAYLNATYPDGVGGSVKEGAWNALGDWKIGNDAGATFTDLTHFAFMGYAADGDAANLGGALAVGDGFADGYVQKTFKLGAGDYSIFVGGADYAAQALTNPNLTKSYGVSVALNVAAVPEPETWALVFAGLLSVGLFRRKAPLRQGH